PKSWKDLWTVPEYKGKIGIYNIVNSAGQMTICLTSKLWTGGDKDIDTAYKKIAELKPFKQTDFSGDMEKLLVQGEVLIGILDMPAAVRLKKSGAPIGWVAPSEGMIMFEQDVAVTAGSKNKPAAFAFGNWMLKRETQEMALLGPSGCGKTTTLRTIAGFEFPDAGEIHFGEHRVTGLPPERRNIGMVFQNYALFPHMTVYGNVAFGLEMRKEPTASVRARVTATLEKVQLGGLEGRYPRQLSGGQQQRAALARALVIAPDVLLLDEPLANLDAKLREEMRFYVRSLQQEVGITTIYVTHDQAEAMVIADRIAVVFNGRI